MKIKVQITETLQRVIELDVLNEEVAIDIVTDQYNADEIILDANDYRDVEIEVIDRLDDNNWDGDDGYGTVGGGVAPLEC